MWPQSPFFFGGWGSPTASPGQRRRGLLSRTAPQQMPGMQPQQIGGAPGMDASSLGMLPGVQQRGGPRQMPGMSAQPIDSAPADLNALSAPLPQIQRQPQNRWQGLQQSVVENRMPLLALGAGLLDVAEGNGTWSGAAQGFMGARDAQDQRAIQTEELDYMRGERTQQQQERERAKAEYDRILADPNTPPDVKAAVRAAGISGLADIMQSQVVTAAQKAETEARNAALAQDESQFSRSQQFQAQQGALNRAAQNRGLSQEFGMGRYFQSQDAKLLGEQMALTAQIQSVGLPALQNVQQTIAQARAIGGVAGQPLAAGQRVTLGRLFNGSGEGRPTLEVWRAQVLTPALEAMRGLGAMTEKEFEAAMSSFANPDMTLEAAETLINQKLTEANRRIATASISQEFALEADGLTGVNNKAGENYPTFLARRLQDMGLSGAVPPPNPRPTQRPAASAQNRGRVWVDENGARWKSDGRGWVRQGAAPAASTESPMAAARRYNNGNIR